MGSGTPLTPYFFTFRELQDQRDETSLTSNRPSRRLDSATHTHTHSQCMKPCLYGDGWNFPNMWLGDWRFERGRKELKGPAREGEAGRELQGSCGDPCKGSSSQGLLVVCKRGEKKFKVLDSGPQQTGLRDRPSPQEGVTPLPDRAPQESQPRVVRDSTPP